MNSRGISCAEIPPFYAAWREKQMTWFLAEYMKVLFEGMRQPFVYVWLLGMFVLGLPHYGHASMGVVILAALAPALVILRLWSEGRYSKKEEAEKKK